MEVKFALISLSIFMIGLIVTLFNPTGWVKVLCNWLGIIGFSGFVAPGFSLKSHIRYLYKSGNYYEKLKKDIIKSINYSDFIVSRNK